jgi:N-acyl-D-amino-acid deacylase
MHDLVINGGWVVDGIGGPAFRSDVGIDGDTISAIGPALSGRRTLDASGCLVAPGFVDMHSHSDLDLLQNPTADAKLMQGVVTEVIGQDGLSYAPVDDESLAVIGTQTAAWNGELAAVNAEWRSVAEYLDALEAAEPSVNVAYLVPHGTLRLLAVGSEDRAATDLELVRMRRLLRTGLQEGAVGLSTGLTYTPAMFADTEELVALCEELAAVGGYFAPHTRSYGKGVMEAYAEVVDVSLRSGAPLHLTHCQISFAGNEGRAAELITMLDAIDPMALEVTADSYPYEAGSTYLAAFLPTWVWSDGVDGVITALGDDEKAERIRHELEDVGTPGFHGARMDWSAIAVSSVGSEKNRAWTGRRIDEVAASLGASPWEAARRLLIEERLNVNIITHVGHEDNMRAIMQLPFHMGGSDGLMMGAQPHPRAWGTFARYLGMYARDEGLFSWPEIVRKLSALPNLRLKRFDRGLLRPGMKADMVVFDPESVRDTATFDDPRQHPEGIPHVVVNGSVVKEAGLHTGARPGRILRSMAAEQSA